MSFLNLEGVSKYYGDFGALIDMTLSVERGEFISLLGPSGCGKTTTLQAIAGLTPVTRGRITLDGRDITNLPVNQRGLGIVFQSYALFPHMTVAENVSFGLEMRNMPKHERDARIAQMLELVHAGLHLPDPLDHEVRVDGRVELPCLRLPRRMATYHVGPRASAWHWHPPPGQTAVKNDLRFLLVPDIDTVLTEEDEPKEWTSGGF